MEKIRIIGIRVTPEVQDAVQIQNILTMYGNIIRTRLGLNEETDDRGNRYGIILLELSGDPEQFDALQERLLKIHGLSVQSMEF
ncbi:MAG TPA: hypothetical protein P5228_06725 [Bacteroidales bacterium]|nr:hypothetical protein [Bacteroidales bacterium]HRZ48217.1 hypothetical protein [Bacteroidales bacterium]